MWWCVTVVFVLCFWIVTLPFVGVFWTLSVYPCWVLPSSHTALKSFSLGLPSIGVGCVVFVLYFVTPALGLILLVGDTCQTCSLISSESSTTCSFTRVGARGVV